MDSNFQGTKADLFDLWNVYDNYREEQIKAGLFNPFKGHSFNPWMITKATPPGAAKYHQVVNYKENNSLEDALNSLHKKGIIEWKPCIMYVPIIKTTEFVDSIDRLKTWKEYSEDCNKRLELIAQLAETENCVLSPELFQVGLYVSRELYDWWSELYYGTNGKELPNECATVAQETMYENYQKYIQQLTVSDCSNNEKLCPVEDLPKRYKFFTDWTYRRKFNDLDKIWKDKLLGWTQVRKELFFKMTDGMRALKYLERYSSKLAFKLGKEYITFMNDHMQSTKIYYTENYASDFKGVLPKKRSDELFPLSTSRSATQLHDKLMKLYN